jgi:hypothetical protein
MWFRHLLAVGCLQLHWAVILYGHLIRSNGWTSRFKCYTSFFCHQILLKVQEKMMIILQIRLYGTQWMISVRLPRISSSSASSSYCGYVEPWSSLVAGCFIGVSSSGIYILATNRLTRFIRENCPDITFVFGIPAILGSIAGR